MHAALRLRRVLVLLCSLSVTALLPPTARAGDYQAFVDGALEEYRRGNWGEALALFRKAHELSPNARTLRGLGFASFEMRRYAESIRFLGGALGEERKALTPEQRSEVEALIARASAFVVRVQVKVEPEQAELTVDGNEVDREQRKALLLDPGEHQIVAQADGYETAIRSVEWAPGSQVEYAIDLSPQAKPASGDPEVEHSKPTAADATRFGLAKYVLLGATVAAAGVTGAAVALREGRARNLERRDCDTYDESKVRACDQDHRAGERWRAAAIGAGAIGGALAITTLVFLALDLPPEAPAVRSLRVCAPAGASVTCRLSF